MGVSSGKIITTLHERWQIEHGIRELLDLQSEDELQSRAKLVAESGEQVIPVILSNLGHSNPRMLNALGIVSSLHPNRAEMADRLYGAAADVNIPDKDRMAAMLILERFLGVKPDPYLIGTLSDPQAMVVESVKEMIRDGEQNPFMLLDYTHGLAAQPDEIVEGIVETLLEVGQERAVPALCLLAQERADALATAAISTLGRLRHPDAARGLQTILPMLHPTRRALGERSLRKLQFSGVPSRSLPPVDSAWRALISPVDGQGSRVIWFIHDADLAGNCAFLGISIREEQGIAQAYGNYQVPVKALPERRHRGYIHSLSPQDELVLYMLEADFDYGRRLVSEGQALNFELGRLLPVEYSLLGTLIWQYDDARVEESRQRLPMPETRLDLLPETAKLLDHPAFKNWFAYGDQVVQQALTMIKWLPFTVQKNQSSVAIKLAETYFDRPVVSRLQTRLRAMSEWLWRAGEAHLTEVALVAARTVATIPPTSHPFTLRMVELGLRVVIEQLQKQLNQDIHFKGSRGLRAKSVDGT